MYSTIIVDLDHQNGKITQKRVSNNFELFYSQIFEFTNKTEAASDYVIQYKLKTWKDIKTKENFNDFLKIKNKKIIRIKRKDENNNENLTKLFCAHIEQGLKLSKLYLFEKMYQKLILERLRVKEEVKRAVKDRKMDEKMNLLTKDSGYLYNPIENPFHFYSKIYDITPAYKKRVIIPFNEMSLSIDNSSNQEDLNSLEKDN